MLWGVDDEELLPIGAFARLGRLSVKQVRHYGELGLLVPAWVDEATGYRYYRASQVRAALSIGLLRSMDVPLAVIAQVLGGSAQALESVREGLEAELARRRRALASLERVMARGLPSAEVRVVVEPACLGVVVRERASGEADVARATSAGVGRLLEFVGAAGPGAGAEGVAPVAGPGVAVRLVGLFPLDMQEPMEVGVALVVERAPSGVLPAGGRVEVLAGGAFACATHVGPYDQIGLTVHAVLAWCAERRHAVRGPIREVYVSDPSVTAPEELVTHLMIPLEEEPCW
ncbi:MerR family transcriptional regulator [Nonomuraea sp. SMC257]|uniref:MerR family transcriptional regulator n=1 Tax=Nonomuraea montanisoli TaxID=2741721 RepID=A0A7Y6M471_9ACTN|nr:MerR family transcriptional regulator [Nonomuraea montanisoli]NUW33200.1 MerR family transcriptional regulator [Nonomuraea montanisoli]